jgi:hypothetical protein
MRLSSAPCVDDRATGAAEPQRVRCTSHALQSHGCHASATTTPTTPKAPHVGEVFAMLLDEVRGGGNNKRVSKKCASDNYSNVIRVGASLVV